MDCDNLKYDMIVMIMIMIMMMLIDVKANCGDCDGGGDCGDFDDIIVVIAVCSSQWTATTSNMI